MKTMICSLMVVALLCCGTVYAQVPATGGYPFGTFDNHGFDAINVGNLNVRFSIPIVSRTGRGLPFNYSLQYEGLVWSPVVSASGNTWALDPSYGFAGSINGSPISGYLTYIDRKIGCPRPPGWSHNPPPTDYYTNFVYHDPYGVNHSFHYEVQEPCVTDDDGNETIVGDGSSKDGSGYTLLDMSTVQTRTGMVIQPPSSPTGIGGSITDNNGNQITSNGSSYVDTFGSTALTLGGGATASSPRTLTYPAAQQGNNPSTGTATIYYRTYTIRTHFACSNNPADRADYGVSQVLTSDLVDHITLADNQSTYNFTYEPTPGATDGAVTARLASVRLPQGGVIGYSYSGPNGGIDCNDGSTLGVVRTMQLIRAAPHGATIAAFLPVTATRT